MVLPADLREMLRGRSESLHVLDPCVAKHLSGDGRLRRAALITHHVDMFTERIRTIGVLKSERAPFHLFKAESHDALRETALDKLLRHKECRRSRGAVVIHVVNGDT